MDVKWAKCGYSLQMGDYLNVQMPFPGACIRPMVSSVLDVQHFWLCSMKTIDVQVVNGGVKKEEGVLRIKAMKGLA